eukprot:327024_1
MGNSILNESVTKEPILEPAIDLWTQQHTNAILFTLRKYNIDMCISIILCYIPKILRTYGVRNCYPRSYLIPSLLSTPLNIKPKYRLNMCFLLTYPNDDSQELYKAIHFAIGPRDSIGTKLKINVGNNKKLCLVTVQSLVLNTNTKLSEYLSNNVNKDTIFIVMNNINHENNFNKCIEYLRMISEHINIQNQNKNRIWSCCISTNIMKLMQHSADKFPLSYGSLLYSGIDLHVPYLDVSFCSRLNVVRLLKYSCKNHFMLRQNKKHYLQWCDYFDKKLQDEYQYVAKFKMQHLKHDTFERY